MLTREKVVSVEVLVGQVLCMVLLVQVYYSPSSIAIAFLPVSGLLIVVPPSELVQAVV